MKRKHTDLQSEQRAKRAKTRDTRRKTKETSAKKQQKQEPIPVETKGPSPKKEQKQVLPGPRSGSLGLPAGAKAGDQEVEAKGEIKDQTSFPYDPILMRVNLTGMFIPISGPCYVCGATVDEGAIMVDEKDSNVFYLCDGPCTKQYDAVHFALAASLGFFYATTWYGRIVKIRRESGKIQEARILPLQADKSFSHNSQSEKKRPYDRFRVVWHQKTLTSKPQMTPAIKKLETLPSPAIVPAGYSTKLVTYAMLHELNPDLPALEATKTWNGLPVHPTIVDKTHEAIQSVMRA